MKTIYKAVLERKKIFAILIMAFLLPLILVAYLVFDTFSKRQESTRKILESNLWFSGEAALELFENELIKYEDQLLTTQYLEQVLNKKTIDNSYHDSLMGSNLGFDLFILGNNLKIIFPINKDEKTNKLHYEQNLINPEFEEEYSRAEKFEFIHNNLSEAISYYKRANLNAKTNTQIALSLEGLSRSYIASKNYPLALKSLDQLKRKYSKLVNKAGHPYGIISELQLYEVSKIIGSTDSSIQNLLGVYKKMKNGYWILSSSLYEFFKEEIESILDMELANKSYLEYRNHYNELRKSITPCEKDHELIKIIKEHILSKIRNEEIYNYNKTSQTARLFINGNLLVYKKLNGSSNEIISFAGFRLNKNRLKHDIIPLITKKVTNETGLICQLIEEKKSEIIDVSSINSDNSINLPFRKVPLPYELLVIQPAFDELEKDIQREVVLYGILFIIILLLMTLGFVLISRDIARESETIEKRTEFVHNVSHELKTPLSLIRLYGDTLLLKKNLSEEVTKDALMIITKESERLSHMINNILDFSRIEMGKKEFELTKGNLSETVFETLESYRYHLEKKGFKIIEKINIHVPEISFDKEAIEGVVVNLLSNAIKYSKSVKEVTIKLFVEEDNLILQISDRGIGIQPEDVSNVFNRFFRSKQRSGVEARGSGLGLTIVKHVVEAHGGIIKVVSTPDKGTLFSIILPVKI